jgi:U32 family peptidase
MAQEIGKITHFFDKVGVAVIEISSSLKVGDEIQIKGMTTNFVQKVDSMQVEHKEIEKAEKGDFVGIKVKEKVRVNDLVFLFEDR